MTETKQPERPINCGTGYCSCIECPYEQAQPEQAQPEKPIAFFDFQERGFYWATYTYISPVPVAIKVEPIPLFTESQLKQAVRDAYEDAASVVDNADSPDCGGWDMTHIAERIRALIKEGT